MGPCVFHTVDNLKCRLAIIIDCIDHVINILFMSFPAVRVFFQTEVDDIFPTPPSHYPH